MSYTYTHNFIYLQFELYNATYSEIFEFSFLVVDIAILVEDEALFYLLLA